MILSDFLGVKMLLYLDLMCLLMVYLLCSGKVMQILNNKLWIPNIKPNMPRCDVSDFIDGDNVRYVGCSRDGG
ncbi:hypothetical protein K1719_007413 [Acacia pycnantha]|nr:hypothetical protein K1719_007413 [Acacia pycnantha]